MNKNYIAKTLTRTIRPLTTPPWSIWDVVIGSLIDVIFPIDKKACQANSSCKEQAKDNY